MLWIALWACSEPTQDTAEPVGCPVCLDSPYHTCGGYVATSEGLSCAALSLGVAVSDWAAYSVTVDGALIPTVRAGGRLHAACDGQAVINIWTVDPEAPGCGLVEAIPQTCGAIEAGVHWDPDVTGWAVEAMTPNGAELVIEAYTTQNRLFGVCPEEAKMVRVVGVLPDLEDVGAGPVW